ncbi:aldehyde dehydrogenase family protein, partial [Xanthomonas citri pv. citri]|nr:aldehyde dehydrogenase family protein [Xanthomonas citri pv. citri]
AANEGKRVQALGGAKNHMVVMPDADLESAAAAAVSAAFGSAGERCMAISVAVPVGAETADRLIALLRERVKDLRVGPSLEASSDFGPVVSKDAKERIEGYIAAGVE